MSRILILIFFLFPSSFGKASDARSHCTFLMLIGDNGDVNVDNVIKLLNIDVAVVDALISSPSAPNRALFKELLVKLDEIRGGCRFVTTCLLGNLGPAVERLKSITTEQAKLNSYLPILGEILGLFDSVNAPTATLREDAERRVRIQTSKLGHKFSRNQNNSMKFFRHLRDAKGLTLSAIALRADLSLATIMGVLGKNPRPMTFGIFLKLKKGMEIADDELVSAGISEVNFDGEHTDPVGELVYRERLKRGLSQAKVIKEINITTQSRLSDIELGTGAAIMSAALLSDLQNRLLRFYGISQEVVDQLPKEPYRN